MNQALRMIGAYLLCYKNNEREAAAGNAPAGYIPNDLMDNHLKSTSMEDSAIAHEEFDLWQERNITSFDKEDNIGNVVWELVRAEEQLAFEYGMKYGFKLALELCSD